MIVVDASAVVELLVGEAPATDLWREFEGELAAPHLLDIEVLSALRGLVRGGVLSPGCAEDARRAYADLTIAQYEAAPIADRIWALRAQCTSYDAAYLALAEGLGAPLVTCDSKLDAGGHRAEVRVYSRGS